VRGYRGPKKPKQYSRLRSSHHQHNQCGRVMDDAYVNNTGDRLDIRNGG
jgi:hypothetical protein